MKLYTKDMLENYLRNDWILDLLRELESDEDKAFRTHAWLKEMDNKRMIYADVYGDLLTRPSGLKVLDVGGGYTALTKRLAEYQDYTLLDFMAHGGNQAYLNGVFSRRDSSLAVADWYEYASSSPDYDLIIANDLFPDVDQRLALFLDRFLGKCKEMRITITFYNTPKFYTTKRTNDSEIMTFLSYDGEITSLILNKYLDRSDASKEELCSLKDFKESIYRNGRQICYIRLKGGLSEPPAIGERLAT